jgi:dTDP-4-amino-4,6-dideoxygalactose transaminase
VARQLGETSLMFMVHPTLTEEDMRDTVAAVGKVMGPQITQIHAD